MRYGLRPSLHYPGYDNQEKETTKPVNGYTYPQLPNAKATIRPGSILNRQGGSVFDRPEQAQFAVDRFARPYDDEEIARITARIVGSALGFKKSEIKRNDEYICSEYVYECYGCIGLKIEYDKRGFVAPADFSVDQNMALLYEVEVESGNA